MKQKSSANKDTKEDEENKNQEETIQDYPPNKTAEHRITNDTSNKNPDSQQRTNFNTSMQNFPRGIINTAFSLNSSISKEEIPPLPAKPQIILKHYIKELTDYEKGEVLDFDMVYFLGKSKKDKVDEKNCEIKEQH